MFKQKEIIARKLAHLEKMRGYLAYSSGRMTRHAEQYCRVKLGVEPSNQRGFTLVELITVMVIVGILAVAALPRFFDRNVFDSRGFYDQAISTLRYAQKAAVAQHRFVCVAFGANSITLTYGASATCGSDLTSPTGLTPYVVTAPSGVTLSGGAVFNFDRLGRASAAQSITVSGYATAITVEAETGYVH